MFLTTLESSPVFFPACYGSPHEIPPPPHEKLPIRKKALTVIFAVCLLVALVGSGVYWFFLREEPLVIESVTPREKITVETDLQPAPVVADVYAPNSGFGTYWSARNSHEREGVSLGEEVVIDWDSVEPRTVNQSIHVIFHNIGMGILPDAYQNTVPRVFRNRFAETNFGWQVRYAAMAAEVLDTELALEMAAAWARLAPPDQFVEAYTRVGVVLGNAGWGEALESLARFERGKGDPLRMRPVRIPELFPIEWAAEEDTPAGLWQRHQWYLLMNERRKAGQALEALEALAEQEDTRDRFLRWFRNNGEEARKRYERLGRDSRDVLLKNYQESLPAMREVLTFYRKIADQKDYEAVIEEYDDEALFQLVEYFGDTLTPHSLEYVDILLYAIEMRRLERWDWSSLHLTHGGQLAAKHYHETRSHPIFRIALAQAAYAPELLGLELESQEFKATRVGILNHATENLHPMMRWQSLSREETRAIAREYHPYFKMFREEADSFIGQRQIGGVRRDFYRRYILVENYMGLLDENVEKWLNLAESDPQRSVRGEIRSRLRIHFGRPEPNVPKLLKLAGISLFDAKDEEHLKRILQVQTGSQPEYRRHPEKRKAYVEGITRLLDRLEEEWGDDQKLSLEPYRERLVKNNQTER